MSARSRRGRSARRPVGLGRMALIALDPDDRQDGQLFERIARTLIDRCRRLLDAESELRSATTRLVKLLLPRQTLQRRARMCGSRSAPFLSHQWQRYLLRLRFPACLSRFGRFCKLIKIG